MGRSTQGLPRGVSEVMRDPQVTIGFNTKMVIHDLDDLG